jgi:hypothetical protein
MPADNTERSQAILNFQGDWRQVQHGEIMRGGELTIHYDPVRLTECRRWFRGALLWDITAHVRFQPGGSYHEGKLLRDVRSPPHGPVVDKELIPFTVIVPDDTEQVTIWFESVDYLNGCHAWDSQYGQNYTYVVRSG